MNKIIKAFRVVPVNNPDVVQQIRLKAVETIPRIRAHWENKIREASDAYHGMFFLLRWWHCFLSLFTWKNKLDNLSQVKLKYDMNGPLHIDILEVVINEIDLSGSIDLTEREAKCLYMEDFWNKHRKITLRN